MFVSRSFRLGTSRRILHTGTDPSTKGGCNKVLDNAQSLILIYQHFSQVTRRQRALFASWSNYVKLYCGAFLWVLISCLLQWAFEGRSWRACMLHNGVQCRSLIKEHVSRIVTKRDKKKATKTMNQHEPAEKVWAQAAHLAWPFGLTLLSNRVQSRA